MNYYSDNTRFKVGTRFQHSFDLGIFILVEDNNDGTGEFFKEENGNKICFTIRESRVETFNFSEMRYEPS